MASAFVQTHDDGGDCRLKVCITRERVTVRIAGRHFQLEGSRQHLQVVKITWDEIGEDYVSKAITPKSAAAVRRPLDCLVRRFILMQFIGKIVALSGTISTPHYK